MSKNIAVKRLTKEYKDVQKNPDNLIEVRFDEDNMMNIYYLLTGSPDTPYEGGSYFGCIKVKDNYPFSPPSIMMITPNGRFQENTRICLSMSDFHPESWNPAWTATRTIPMALLSFMNSEENASGCVSSSEFAKRTYATKSKEWNSNNLIFKKVFGDKIKEYQDQKNFEAEKKKKEILAAKISFKKAEDSTKDLMKDLVQNPENASNEKGQINTEDPEDTIRIKQSLDKQTEQKFSYKKYLYFGSVVLVAVVALILNQ
ncbi:hypothetical protein QEN19_003497 [Hanseniaspora menglaensis]